MASRWGVLGRERELVELDRVWSDAVAGAGCVLVLDGEAGVGKTALAVALVEAAAVAPVWVSCVEQAVPAPQGVLGAVVAGLELAPERTDPGADVDARVVEPGLLAAAAPEVRTICMWTDRLVARTAPRPGRGKLS